MAKRVQKGSDLTTWGTWLEEIQPIGIRHVLGDSGDKSKIWGVVYPGGKVWSSVPASVAKASGLPDITTPRDRYRDDLELARNKLNREQYTNDFDPRRQEKASATAARIRELEEMYNDATKDELRDEVASMTYQEAWELIDHDDVYRSSRPYAELLAEHPHLYVVRSVAASDTWRGRFGPETREALLTHPDETVRANFVQGNRALNPARLFQVAETDPSPEVAARARANLTERGWSATREPTANVDYEKL